VGLKLIGTHQLLASADVNLLRDNRYYKEKHKSLFYASTAVDLEINVEKTKYMFGSSPEEGKIHDINIGNRSFGNASQFKYLGMTIINQNLIEKKIKRKLNSFIHSFR
jgi:hypothetical protein